MTISVKGHFGPMTRFWLSQSHQIMITVLHCSVRYQVSRSTPEDSSAGGAQAKVGEMDLLYVKWRALCMWGAHRQKRVTLKHAGQVKCKHITAEKAFAQHPLVLTLVGEIFSAQPMFKIPHPMSNNLSHAPMCRTCMFLRAARHHCQAP